MAQITRRFLGKTTGFAHKGEQRFENDHLKAYLKGQDYFGPTIDIKDPMNKILGQRKAHRVQYSYYEIHPVTGKLKVINQK